MSNLNNKRVWRGAAALLLGLVTCGGASSADGLDGSGDVYPTLADAERATTGWGTPRNSASATGGPLRIGSFTYERGIGMHAPCELTFATRGKYRWLTFYAGISDEMIKDGSVVVQVWLDGKMAHQTPLLRIKQPPVYVCLPVDGAGEVRIVGTDGGNGNAADHLSLGNLRLCASEAKPAPDGPKPAPPLVIHPLVELAGKVPPRGAASVVPAERWEFAMVSGNGRMGAMALGHPTRETVIANHCRLFLPLGSREIVPDLAEHLPELRRVIREQGYRKAMEFLLGKAREQGFPGLIWTDPYHPGFFLRLTMPHQGELRDYVRTEDFANGELTVAWRDDAGPWRRRMFVSRTENVIAMSITGPGDGKVSCAIAPQAVGEQRIQSTLQLDGGWITYHNVYQHGKGGYDAAIRIVPRGGTIETDDATVRVRNADEVVLLLRIVPWKTPLPTQQSEAWEFSPSHPDFVESRIGAYDPAPPLFDSSVVAYRAADDAAELLPKVKQSLAALPADYEKLLASHTAVHGELFHRVTLDVGGGAERAATSEHLLDVAAKEDRLPPALLEKMYDAGRYMFICSAGERPPNLQGIWTGTWKPSWSGDYTLDTNLQLSLKHGFSGNLPELMESHYRLIESFQHDWQLNAQRTYGCRGVLSNARASNNCLLLHWGEWWGVFWTGGAGWLTHFFHDDYLYRGDREMLASRTVPLLKQVAAFYEDFMLLDPDSGQYEFIPSYSPESGPGITATMDVMVVRETLTSLIGACQTLGIEQENVAKWQAMRDKLPAYRVNDDGALAEWVPAGYGEAYKHRHLSHLHAAYEANGELTPEKTPQLWRAAQEATQRRIDSGGERSSHGRVHMGLAAAYLRLGEEAYGRVAVMATGKSMYPSLMCAHEPDQRIYNVDANGAIPEIVNRMLVGSQVGTLDLLPALPAALPAGSIRGILARGQIRIDLLSWDQKARTLHLELTSAIEQTVLLRVPGIDGVKTIRSSSIPFQRMPAANSVEARLPAGRKVTVDIAW